MKGCDDVVNSKFWRKEKEKDSKISYHHFERKNLREKGEKKKTTRKKKKKKGRKEKGKKRKSIGLR